MSNFYIQNAQVLLSQAGNLQQINENILKVQEQLTDCCSQINSAWQSQTDDKASYLGNLEKNLQKIQALCNAINSLSNKLTDFAQQSIRNANNG